MGEYDVKYQIRIPQSRNPQTGAVKYVPDGYVGKSVTVSASSPEEARRIATKSPEVARARAFSADRIDYDMPKPRVKILDIKPRGGGAIEQGPLAAGKRGVGRLPRKMRGGGAVMAGRGGKFKGVM